MNPSLDDDATLPPSDETRPPASEDRASGGERVSGARNAPPIITGLPIGTTVGPFQIGSKLGEGGMGVVYMATDERLRRSVALKVLPQEIAGDSGRKQRFMREARSAAALVHPNIATVFEVGEADGQVFLAMELIEGVTLRAHIAGERLPLAEATRIAGEVARGLARAHKAGIVHRDLKPDNVMITDEGDVKILDFGLAKRLDDGRPSDEASVLTVAGGVMGTPGYMSPEQARGHKVDARTDVFAFGVILYEMLTGERPFKGRSGADLVAAVLMTTPPPVSDVNIEVDAALADLVHRCIAKDASERPADGQALVALLSGEAEGDESSSSGVREGRRVGNDSASAREGESSTPSANVISQTPTPPGPGAAAGGRRNLAVGVGLAVAAAGVFFAFAQTRGADEVEPSPASEQGMAGLVTGAVSAAPTATAAPEPSEKPAAVEETRRVMLVVMPSDASVELDGAAAVARDGILEIKGKLGSVHRVRIFKGKTEIEGDVSITMSGAIPPKMDLAAAKPKGGPTPLRVKNFDE